MLTKHSSPNRPTDDLSRYDMLCGSNTRIKGSSVVRRHPKLEGAQSIPMACILSAGCPCCQLKSYRMHTG